MPTTTSRRTRVPRSGLAGKSIDPGSEVAALYLSNQESSPLLRLPGELRSIIYSYLLGGNKTIFVDYKAHDWKRRKVSGELQWVHVVKGGFYCYVWPSEANPFNTTWMYHKKQHRPEMESDGFTLLSQVCRQLYLETATMAMSENTWAFANKYVMNRYLMKEKRFSLAQRRSVRVILVPSAGMLNKTIVNYLGNLKTILVHGKVICELDPKSFEKPTQLCVKRRDVVSFNI